MITHSAKETGQQKEHWGWEWDVTGKCRGRVKQIEKRGGGGQVSNIGKRGEGSPLPCLTM